MDAGAPAAWVTADEVYGQDPKLRAELARRGLGYVLAVAKTRPVTTVIGPRPAAELALRLPARAWQRLSAGPGAKGPRCYDWALADVTDPAVTEGSDPDDSRMIPLTRHEIRRLFVGLHQQPPAPATQLRWSRWRRRHQATARRCHYQRRQAPVPDP